MNLEFMNLAFFYAEKAFLNNEVPIGAVIVKDGEVISYGYNNKEHKNTVLGHAELIAIKSAEKKLNNWRLDGCDLYVTLDPCPMCASAIKQSRIANVYSALSNSDSNNSEIINKIFLGDNTNPSVNFLSDLQSERAKKKLNSFFEKQRKK
ncbi:MAG: nucleoside deaminase [Bacilli bacterium]|nr:nucleoside deaminase [Bacilli bacterium]